MANQITINFIECDPAPANGYNLKWRVAGSGDPFTDEGNFFSTPIQFTDNDNPEGTCYEGILQSDCTQSGDSGQILGNEIPWNTVCADSGTTYTISLTSPCTGIYSNYLIEGGTPGDVLLVRATFIGSIAKIMNTFTRADLQISSPDGTTDNQSSSCYTDTSTHFISVTADSTVTLASTTAVINLSAVIHNSLDTSTSVTVTIISVNSEPNGAFTSGCKGNSSTGGPC